MGKNTIVLKKTKIFKLVFHRRTNGRTDRTKRLVRQTNGRTDGLNGLVGLDGQFFLENAKSFFFIFDGRREVVFFFQKSNFLKLVLASIN